MFILPLIYYWDTVGQVRELVMFPIQLPSLPSPDFSGSSNFTRIGCSTASGNPAVPHLHSACSENLCSLGFPMERYQFFFNMLLFLGFCVYARACALLLFLKIVGFCCFCSRFFCFLFFLQDIPQSMDCIKICKLLYSDLMCHV